MLTWITLPSPTDLVANVGQYTGSIFSELLPVGLAIAGIFIAVLFVRFIAKSVLNAIQRMTGRGRAGGRRVIRRV
jgi:hypothetical protein